MAIIKNLKRITLERDVPHSEVDCTYSIFVDEKGDKILQIDTYGSSTRKIKGKKSQSLRLNKKIVKQFKKIIDSEFPNL